jgi:hypothetical protein
MWANAGALAGGEMRSTLSIIGWRHAGSPLGRNVDIAEMRQAGWWNPI